MRSRMTTGNRKAFTLIEIMVALVIFTILLTSLFASFRMGMKAYTMSTEHADQQQLGRYAINQVAQDLHNIYFKPESEYNVARRQQEAALDENNAQERSASGRNVIDENLPDLGPPVDLSFTGEDSGELDQLSLVRAIPYSPDEVSKWGLARITYYIVDGTLYRSIDDVLQPDTDQDGNMVPKATLPNVEKLAENCAGFDMKYGYYFEEEWHLADSWDSSGSEYRNPPTEEDTDIVPTMGENASRDVQSQGAAGALSQTLQQQQQQQRADNLPGWIELTFKFAPDKKKPEVVRTYKQTIVMNNKYAAETYVPNDEDDQLKGARANSQRRPTRRSSGSSGSSASGGQL